ncbi:sodium/solute symporter [candidate division KSB1 bacterium]|nr:sodium/solute symporter [candidate division KSB1 bacterium]
MTPEKIALSHWDWFVVMLYALGMLLVGHYFSRRNKCADDYMLGGRSMTSWRVGLSLFATLFSAVSYLSMPGEMVKNGPMYWTMLAALPFVYLIVAIFFIPYIMKLQISSAYELLEKRLGRKNRLLASILFLLMRFVWMSVIIYMCATKVIVPIMGWSENTALWVSVAMGVVTIIYTSAGGLRGVVLTDVVQTFILFGGSIFAIALIARQLGGFSAIIPDQWPDHWADWVFFDTHARISFLTVFIAIFGWHVCTAGSDQMAIQRYLATRNTREARRMYLSSLLSNIAVFFLLALLGLAILAFYDKNPAALPPGRTLIESADLLFPRFIVIGLPAGFSGLVLSGLLAAAMSSLSSGINSSCLVIIKDFILPYRQQECSETAEVRLGKIISAAIGIVIVLLSLVIGNIRGNLLELTYKTINLLVAPLFVPFFMAMFIRRAQSTAVFIGTIVGVLAAAAISFSQELLNLTISFLWIIPGSFLAGALSSWLLSLIPFFLKNHRKADGRTHHSKIQTKFDKK